MNEWIRTAISRISCDLLRSADTHIHKLEIPGLKGIDIYLKDESTHPTGSHGGAACLNARRKSRSRIRLNKS